MTDATEAIAGLRWARTYNTECHIRPRQIVELLAHIDDQAAAIATLELHVETLEVTVTEELITARGQADCIEELKHDLREYMAIADEQAAEIEQLRVDAERYAYAKTLEGQVLVIDVFQHRGAGALDSAIDDAMKEPK